MTRYLRALDELTDRLADWSATVPDVSFASKLELSEIDEERVKVSIPILVSAQSVLLNVRMSKESLTRASTEPAVMEDLFRVSSHQLEVLIAQVFYRDYEMLFTHDFEQSDPIFLKADPPGHCRFCTRSIPVVPFKKLAHAIPESVGNKNLFSRYECDECNLRFGTGIEDHFGRWSNVQRTLFKVDGKRSAPALMLKGGHVKACDDFVEFKVPDNSMATFDEEESTAKWRLIRPSYVPIAVIKAFNKMALSVMPLSELNNFEPVLEWLRNDNHETGLARSYSGLLTTFCPAAEFSKTRCFLMRRSSSDLDKPYMTFVLAFGNFCYQIFLSASAEKQKLTLNVTVNYSPL
jgi:HNH endonuclease